MVFVDTIVIVVVVVVVPRDEGDDAFEDVVSQDSFDGRWCW